MGYRVVKHDMLSQQKYIYIYRYSVLVFLEFHPSSPPSPKMVTEFQTFVKSTVEFTYQTQTNHTINFGINQTQTAHQILRLLEPILVTGYKSLHHNISSTGKGATQWTYQLRGRDR